jgi:hypothetical protein
MSINRTTFAGNAIVLAGSSTFANCEARGGGMFQESGALTASRLRVTRNTATSVRVAKGAGIFSTPAGGMMLSLLTVSANNLTFSTAGYGGGIYVFPQSGRVVMTKLVVRNNSASLLLRGSAAFESAYVGRHLYLSAHSLLFFCCKSSSR